MAFYRGHGTHTEEPHTGGRAARGGGLAPGPPGAWLDISGRTIVAYRLAIHAGLHDRDPPGRHPTFDESLRTVPTGHDDSVRPAQPRLLAGDERGERGRIEAARRLDRHVQQRNTGGRHGPGACVQRVQCQAIDHDHVAGADAGEGEACGGAGGFVGQGEPSAQLVDGDVVPLRPQRHDHARVVEGAAAPSLERARDEKVQAGSSHGVVSQLAQASSFSQSMTRIFSIRSGSTVSARRSQAMRAKCSRLGFSPSNSGSSFSVRSR